MLQFLQTVQLTAQVNVSNDVVDAFFKVSYSCGYINS